MEVVTVMYPFLTLDDGTGIVHSQMLKQGKVKFMLKKRRALYTMPAFRKRQFGILCGNVF